MGKICDALHIDIENRHRAMGDANATAILFSMVLKNDKENFVATALKRNSKEQHLPPNLPKETLEALPAQPGVYYFLDGDNNIIYVGKAKISRAECSIILLMRINMEKKMHCDWKHIISLTNSPAMN